MLPLVRRLRIAALLVTLPTTVAAQTFDALGTRAAGMGGAFVAVADDASAVYWNPAGFASGSYVSLVFDWTAAKLEPDDSLASGRRTGLLTAVGFPALGLSYYRLRDSTVTLGQSAGISTNRLDSLITHHTGATLVQTIVPGLDVGATFKLVRGVASSSELPIAADGSRLDAGEHFISKGSNKFDVDLGFMGTLGPIKAGLTLRNMTEPEFETPGGGLEGLKLKRQARAGIAVAPRTGWLVAADLDLTKTAGPLGEQRLLAFGGEGRVAARATVRGGFRVNTAAGEETGTKAAGLSAGVSYALTPYVMLDAQVTGGAGTRAARGWGVSGRFVY